VLKLVWIILKYTKIIYYLYIYYIFATYSLIHILQVIIDNGENIFHVQSGFLSHEKGRNFKIIHTSFSTSCLDNLYFFVASDKLSLDLDNKIMITQIGSIGPNAHLKCPDNCYILGDCIYPNCYPVITPYKVTDIIRQPRAIKRARRKFNMLLQ
jgi:hypothetical protein